MKVQKYSFCICFVFFILLIIAVGTFRLSDITFPDTAIRLDSGAAKNEYIEKIHCYWQNDQKLMIVSDTTTDDTVWLDCDLGPNSCMRTQLSPELLISNELLMKNRRNNQLMSKTYVYGNNHFRRSGIKILQVTTPTISLEANANLVDFACSPSQQNNAWIIKKVTPVLGFTLLHRLIPRIPELTQTRVSLLVQTGHNGEKHEIAALLDWPEANTLGNTDLQWSPDASRLSFVYRNSVYILLINK